MWSRHSLRRGFMGPSVSRSAPPNLGQPALQKPRRSRGLWGPRMAGSRPKINPTISGHTAFKYPRKRDLLRATRVALHIHGSRVRNAGPVPGAPAPVCKPGPLRYMPRFEKTAPIPHGPGAVRGWWVQIGACVSQARALYKPGRCSGPGAAERLSGPSSAGNRINIDSCRVSSGVLVAPASSMGEGGLVRRGRVVADHQCHTRRPARTHLKRDP